MNEADAKLFFRDVENNDYFIRLYAKVTRIYCSFTVEATVDEEFTDKEKNDLLMFADILACSSDCERKYKHEVLAHIIAVEMRSLYPADEAVKAYVSDIFEKTGNHIGKGDGDIALFDINEAMFNAYLDRRLAIPGMKGERFFIPQKKIFDSLGLNTFSYSAPTSMGKSMMIRVFIKEQIEQGSTINFALVIPSRALINELKSDIINELKETLQEKKYRVVSNIGDEALNKGDSKYVFVVTPERLLYILINRPDINIGYLFIDESHKISCFNTRGPYYYKIVEMLKSRNHDTKFIFAAPNIPNPDEYLKMTGRGWSKRNYYRTTYSPVSQIKMIVNLEKNELRAFNDLTSSFAPVVSLGFEGDVDSRFASWLKRIIWNGIGEERKTLIYVYKKADAFKYARQLASIMPKLNNPKLDALAKEIREQIHKNYELADFIEKGIAAHVGYLPPSIRIQIEDLFKSDDGIFVLCCTSTLIEGVNLPAENLVITSSKTGQNELSEIEFRNLIGRVGRVSSTLYGNVYMIEGLQKKEDTDFEKLLGTEIPEQKLSVVEELTEVEKKHVIQCLKEGKLAFGKISSNQNDDRAQMMRKFGLALLSDIMKGRDGIVCEEFSKYMEKGDKEIIKEKFTENKMPVDDDIGVSADQTLTLDEAIKNGLCYPSDIKYESILLFLQTLSRIFKWKEYEPKKKLGNDNQLKRYAVLLSKWMSGAGLSQIVVDSIKYQTRNPEKFYFEGKKQTYDNSNPDHVNQVIEDTLETIENVILFSISNYFLKFSTTFKEIKKVLKIHNDWSEFIEYGSSNKTSIWLQKIGFSRESAYYIMYGGGKAYINISARKLYSGICNCRSVSVSKEAKDVFLNYPEEFM